MPMKETSWMARNKSTPLVLVFCRHTPNSTSLQYSLLTLWSACAIAYTASTVTREKKKKETARKRNVKSESHRSEQRTKNSRQRKKTKELWDASILFHGSFKLLSLQQKRKSRTKTTKMKCYANLCDRESPAISLLGASFAFAFLLEYDQRKHK